ncbi:hypothetical protein GQX73_g5448 [Xylaria multiplex]|uniref:2EXR domain-containing protein n=1 Tax=Xylaria multiplex TaxID=323545 RepID=A0A7C8IUB9_9PEZI|nr:hypothetical protein GQX73_g5448 [Xylaria multiplex]
MAPDSFHRFSALPFELRRMIYLFASPPRFVHIQEDHEDEDDFEERFRTTIVPINLHPSIADFARNWRGRIPFPQSRWRWYDGRYQTTLGRYGFKCPRPKQQQPWEPTREVPGISHHFLSENPQVAWQFLRSGSFYSTAPIPALLHVTSESRQVLIDYGYELAFRTRTSGPHTWFNFKTDVLFIGRCSVEEDIRPPCPVNDTPPDVPDASRELWVFTPPLEIDALTTLEGRSDLVQSTGYEHLDLRAYKEDNMGDGSNFFVDTAYKFEQQLASIRDDLIHDGGSPVPYNIPKVRLVYIRYPWVCKAVLDLRQDLWNRYQKSREEDSRSRAIAEALRSIDVPKRLIYETGDTSPPSSFNEEFRDDLEAWEDYHEPYVYDYSDMYEDERARLTWLMTGIISAPEMG